MSKIKKDQHKSDQPKVKYQVINWSSYNKSLVNRGDITLYFAEDVIAEWYSDGPARRGAQEVYSDRCIEMIMLLKVVFKLGYRQVQGFTHSLLRLMDLADLAVPSYTQISRRAKELQIAAFAIPSQGPLHIAFDSTGVKVYGEGEWKVRKHGWNKRRTWRKLHLGVDTQSGFIHCHTLTSNSCSDDAQLEDLLDQIDQPIKEAYLDGAYDTEACWDELIERKINPIIPPQKHAVEWYEEYYGDMADYPRNVAVRRIGEVGRSQWKQEVGYHRRSLSETAMCRYKTIHGNRFYSRTPRPQGVENDLKIKILNIMTAQGMPVSVPRKPA